VVRRKQECELGDFTIMVKLGTVTVSSGENVAIACRCDTGGDCDCLCTAIANFAAACSHEGFCVDWRSKHLCRMTYMIHDYN